MSRKEEQFLSEHVDEQIEALSHKPTKDRSSSANARLVSELQTVFDEDTEIVEHVWARLSRQSAERRGVNAGQREMLGRVRRDLHKDDTKGPQPMKVKALEKLNVRKRSRFLEIPVAILVIVVLVGSMTLLLKSRQSSQANKGHTTPTVSVKTSPTPTIIGQAGLYIATNRGIDRVDSETNKVIWHTNAAFTNTLLVEQGIVIFSGGNMVGPGVSDYYVEALNASNGKQLWSKTSGYAPTYNLWGANGTVYINACDMASASTTCAITALKASTGHKLWSYPSASGSIWMTLQNGVIYGVSGPNFFALNATTSTPLWQKNLQKYPYQDASMTPVVSNGAMYFGTCNMTKQTPGYEACDFFAFDAANGKELWHAPFSNMQRSVLAPPTVVNGIVYVASVDGVVHAYDAKKGMPLWTYHAGSSIVSPLVSDRGMIYVQVPAQNPAHTLLLALKITNRSASVGWSREINVSPGKPNQAPLDIENHLIYLLDYGQNAIRVLDTGTGGEVRTFHPQEGASMRVFSLVS